MNLEDEYQALSDEITELNGKIQVVKNRIEELPNEIEKLENELVEQAISEEPDYQTKALLILGLQLEQKTLTAVLSELKSMVRPISSRRESLVWEMQDIEKAEQRNELLKRIDELRGQGESVKKIRETLNLSQREYERLAA